MEQKEEKCPMIEVSYNISAFDYLDYLHKAVTNNLDFKYREVNQVTARFAGKTVAGTIAIIKALIAAKRSGRCIIIYVLRMRHKDVTKAWGEVLSWLDFYKVPYYCKKGEGEIFVLGSKIKLAGCYVTNSTQISFIGEFQPGPG